MRALGITLCFAASCSGEADRQRALGALQLRRGDVSAAVSTLRAAVQSDPADGTCWLQLGHALFEAQRYDESERAYRTALGRDQQREARRALAQVAMRRGRPGEAERLLRSLLDDGREDLDARLALAALLLGRGDAAGARRTYLPPARSGHWVALYGLGRADLILGASADAAIHFGELEHAAPGYPYGPYGRALLAADRGQAEEACRALALAFARGLTDRRAVERDRSLAPVRKAPCFQSLLTMREAGR